MHRVTQHLSPSTSPPPTRRTSRQEDGQVAPPLRVSDEHCFIVRVPRAVEILILFAPLPPVSRMLQNKRVTGLSFTARVEKPSSIYIVPPSSLTFPLLGGYACWSMCGRRTRPFLGRAFREHIGRHGCPSNPFIIYFHPPFRVEDLPQEGG
jgi:hypothetical protein